MAFIECIRVWGVTGGGLYCSRAFEDVWDGGGGARRWYSRVCGKGGREGAEVVRGAEREGEGFAEADGTSSQGLRISTGYEGDGGC